MNISIGPHHQLLSPLLRCCMDHSLDKYTGSKMNPQGFVFLDPTLGNVPGEPSLARLGVSPTPQTRRRGCTGAADIGPPSARFI